METFIVLVLFLGVAVLDFAPIIKNGKNKERWVYGVLFGVSLCMLILYTLDIPVPGPTEPIKSVVKKLFHVIPK